MEGFWSLLRPWLRPHRGISQERLPYYLGFFEFLHNIRKRGQVPLSVLISLLVTKGTPNTQTVSTYSFRFVYQVGVGCGFSKRQVRFPKELVKPFRIFGAVCYFLLSRMIVHPCRTPICSVNLSRKPYTC